jgi:hypothetical protein
VPFPPSPVGLFCYGAVLRPIRSGLYIMLHPNFAEFHFHALW